MSQKHTLIAEIIGRLYVKNSRNRKSNLMAYRASALYADSKLRNMERLSSLSMAHIAKSDNIRDANVNAGRFAERDVKRSVSDSAS